jgi:hypothetical protein
MNDAQMLMDNVRSMSDLARDQDWKKILCNSDLNGQRTILYQFFFMNYMLSVSAVDVVRQAYQDATQGKFDKRERSIAQRVFTILIRIMESLSDKDLRKNLDEAILDRVGMFDRAQEKLREDQAEFDGD